MRRYVRRRKRRTTLRKRRRRTRRSKLRPRRTHRRTKFVAPTFPRSKLVKFTYSRSLDLITPAHSNTFSFHEWNLGSIFTPIIDPPSTTTPLGYTLWTGIYKGYRVYGVRCQMTISNTSNVTMYATMQPTTITHGTIPQAALYLARQTPACLNVILAPKGAANSTKTISRYYNLRTLHGVSAASYEDDTYCAVWNSSPLQISRLYTGLASSDSVATEVRIDYKLTYFTKLNDRVELTPPLI